ICRPFFQPPAHPGDVVWHLTFCVRLAPSHWPRITRVKCHRPAHDPTPGRKGAG
ncbi:hypothetical protein Pmar_PMAR027251, partial [Perkinsus marinus ATCC 50983]